MWNHGLAMRSLMTARGLSWPEFKDTDMADIIAYIRTLGGVPKTRANPRLANAETGARLFQQKGCAACHSFRGAGGQGGPDLGVRPIPRTLGQFATLMWNHAPAMWSSMQAQRMTPPQFSNQEMADLIAHLFTQRYFDASGSVDRGRRVFEEKGCGSCHSPGGDAPRGPSLASWRGGASPVRLATALWNHGPLMLGTMEQRQIPWPRFDPAEVADLMEFLSAGERPQQRAGGKP
jgi:mono/diheme cytochrome c family protein